MAGGAQRFVEAFLTLANWPSDGDRMIALSALNVIRPWNLSDNYQDWAGVSFAAPERWSAPPPLREKVRAVLSVATAHNERARAALRQRANESLKRARAEERLEVRADISIEQSGALTHVLHYLPQDEEAAITLFTALMLDPAFGARVRKCDLQRCGRYFLKTSEHRKFCSDGHRQEADKLDHKHRQARYRKSRSTQ